MSLATAKSRPTRWAARIGIAVAMVVVLAFFEAPMLQGQGTAYLTGYVQDKSGLAVPNATVLVKDQSTGTTYNLKTTNTGVFRTPDLLPGNYEVTVSAPGFETSVTHDVAVETGQPRGLNLTLQVGTVAQHVEVTAAAPLLKTEDAGLGQNVDYTQVAKLPYFNRSAGILLSLAPSVRYAGEDSISYGASRYNIGGFTNVNVSVDGAVVNGDREDVAQMTFNPTVESLSEVKVTENQYSAEFGRDVGALAQLQTKSGTNSYHGGVYEYARNEALDTFNGFSRTKPVDRQHMFGGTVGGPIKRDKVFFFTSLEGQKVTTPSGFVGTVPTPAERQGDFSALGHTIYDPATTRIDPATGNTIRDSFSGNMINPNRFDSASVKALAFIPMPNQPGLVNNLTGSTGTRVTRSRGVTRFDWNIRNSDRLSGVWMFDHVLSKNLGLDAYNKINPAASPTLGGFGFKYFTQVYNFHEFHTFSPRLFLDVQYVDRPRYITRDNPSVDPSKHFAESLGIKNFAGALLPVSFGGDLGFPSYNFTGYTSLGPGFLLFQERPIRERSFDVALTYIYGKHTFKTGFGMEWGEHGAPDQSLPTGLFNFVPTETALPPHTDMNGNRISAIGGDATASFLLGQVDSATTTLGPLQIWQGYYYDAYIEDDWKVRPNLTFNLGFRWDIDAPIYENQNEGNSFDFFQLNPVSATPGVVKFFNGPGYPFNDFYNTDLHRFAPRFGFAWEMMPKTVIRGGYGIFNTAPLLGANRRAPNLGFVTSASFSSPDGGTTPTFTLANGFPAYPLGGDRTKLNDGFGAVPPGTPPNTTPTFVQRDWKFGYAQNFNLSVERELPWKSVVEVAAQGVLGRNLSIFQNWNEVPPNLWGIAGPNFPRRPFPQFNQVTQVKSQKGTTNYYDGYVRFNKRFSQGLNVIANYSYGRTIGFLSGDVYLPQLSRGPVIYDEANGVTAVPYQTALISWVYELPLGPRKPYLSRGVASKVFGGWSIGGVLTFLGGVPFNISSGIDSLNANCGCALANRVNIVGNPNAGPQSHDRWFNTAAFAKPAFGTIGNFGSGTLLGPSDRRLDASIQKSTKVTERFDVKFVAEFFNFTNTLQFGPPDNNLSSPTFGRTLGQGGGLGANTTGPYGARNIQLGLRVDF